MKIATGSRSPLSSRSQGWRRATARRFYARWIDPKKATRTGRLSVRKSSEHQPRARRRLLPSWRGTALATIAVFVALVQLSGSSAAPGDPPNLIGDWSAPQPWTIVKAQ